jgi:hypothetical protein
VAAFTEWRLGFAAERRPLESVARPLSATEACDWQPPPPKTTGRAAGRASGPA